VAKPGPPADAEDERVDWQVDTTERSSVRAVQAEVSAVLRDLGATDGAVHDAELILTELIGNVVRHAPGRAQVSLSSDAGQVLLTVEDDGAGFAYRPTAPVDARAESGRGLFIVAALAQDVQVSAGPAGGTRIAVQLPFTPEAAVASPLQPGLAEPLRVVHTLTAALHQTGSAAGFYEHALDTIVSTLGVSRASLLLYDADGVMRFKAWRGLSAAYRKAVEGHTPWQRGDRSAVPIVVPDVTADPELAELLPVLQAEGIGALAFLPLITRDGLIGKFMLYRDRAHPLNADEIALAEVLAGQIALGTERQRAHDELRAAAERAQTAAQRLASLQKVTAELSRAVTTGDVAAVALGVALAELGAHTGSLCMLQGEELYIAAASGYEAEVLRHWGRFSLHDDLPASEAVRTGRAVFLASSAERSARYPVFAASPVVRDEAYAIIPLGAEIPLGALVMGFPQPRTFTAQDEAFLAALATQCAAALARAALYEERERARLAAEAAARTLQAALLPPRLPEIDGLDLGARYLAGSAHTEVGGDFYDVFPLYGNRHLVVLGDVCGRGVEAATTALLIRHVVRSAAVNLRIPAAILAHVNDVLCRHNELSPDADPRFATAVVAVVHPRPDGSVAIHLAVAGHPLPLLRRPDGEVRTVGVPGCLLGITDAAGFHDHALVLTPGDALVCYTDGVTERRDGNVFFGEARLATLLAGTPGEADALAGAVESAVAGFAVDEPSDDLAVLVLRAPAG
jgi:serine phosphatase RsbU (regulator of sigma subunit)/anti-sigma regulatory factor (Ser/Thr protein kinase)